MNKPQTRLHRIAVVLGSLCLVTGAASARSYEVAALSDDLTQLSLDELLNIEVTSVSKRAEPLSRAAAAVYVLTGEEIHRSGARSIAEALRLVPGMNVARTNANTYAISARGFQSGGDKLQVLIDGRSVYTPLTSAVFWDVLDTYLLDIDRIEVIRGPGATLWGANAVNGVINIITLSSNKTLGGSLVAGVGSEDRAHAGLRSGAKLGDNATARFYAKAYDRDHARLVSGADARDAQVFQQAGMRLDGKVTERQSYSLSGDVYGSRVSANGALTQDSVESRMSGANLNGRGSLDLGDGDQLDLALTFDQYRRVIPQTFGERRETYDASLQHLLNLGDGRHKLIYGASYRYTQDETEGPPQIIIFDPASRSLKTYGAFVQDQIQIGENLTWTLGSKFEHNDLTGFEIQPSTRIGWQFSPDWFGWAALSRAVRTPNRLDHDIAIFCPAPVGIPGICGPNTTLRIGNPEFDSEKLIAYEGGLRYVGGSQWSGDVAVFYNDYADLRSTETAPPFFSFQNQLEGEALGLELSATWKPGASTEVKGSYSLLQLDLRAKPGSTDTDSARNIEGGSPQHQAGLQGSWWITPKWALYGFLRHVSELERVATPSATTGAVNIPAYSELALRVAWKPTTQLELALMGDNLLDAQHPEYGSESSRSELQRGVKLDLTWQWQ